MPKSRSWKYRPWLRLCANVRFSAGAPLPSIADEMYLGNVTGFDVKMAKLEPHHEDDVEHPEASDLFLYAINKDTNEIVDTDTLLTVLNKNSQVIVRYLETFRIRRIQGVSVQEKISQMGTTEIAIIALSSVIFLGAVLGIVLLCSSCQRKKLRKRQKTWEQQRLCSIKNPLMGKVAGNPYGGRIPGGPPVGGPPSNLQYNNVDDVPMDYNDSLTDTYSVNKHNKMKLRQTAPDGASTLNPPRSPRFERYGKNESGWYDNRDVDTAIDALAPLSIMDNVETTGQTHRQDCLVVGQRGEGGNMLRHSEGSR